MHPDELKQQAQIAYNREIAKRNIQQQMQSRLTLQCQDGVFVVSSELINFLSNWEDEELILLDSYQTPIKINREELLYKAKQRYREVMNEWQLAHEEYIKIRSAKHV
jgi:hypothetical protein